MNITYDAAVWDEDEMILPEGGLDIDDLSTGEDDSYFGDDQNDDEVSQEPDGAAKAAPTTEQSETAATGETQTEAPTTETQPEKMPTKLKFTAKIDRKDQDVELDFTELPGIYQRAQNYDRLQKKSETQAEKIQLMEALSAQLGYDSVDDMLQKAQDSDRTARIQALVDEGTSEKIAADFVDREIAKVKADRTAKAKAAEQDTVHGEKGTNTQSKTEPDFKAQVEELFRLRPDLKKDLKTLPQEVVTEVVEKNTPLRIAYAEWEAKQLRAENDRIRKERELFAQQAETASRAPVRGATDRKEDKGEKVDAWLAAFDEADEW